MLKSLYILLLLILLNSCGVHQSTTQPEREFRGFWVATVVNIDWPKNATDAIEKKKKDYINILNFYEDLNFNAAIVQIRTAGDAFYKSDLAPWSRFLTGQEGKAPETEENLLQWMIDETHSRGMEFHAWLNPYRATFNLKTEILSPKHDFNTHNEWMLKYGKKYYYNPGLPEVQEHIVAIIDEIISNYTIDAIHFDDYFYPYTIKNEVFKDSVSYYNCSTPNQNIDDWRRSNIDSLIKKSHAVIKAKKPWVQFGVSPFGVWKNNTTDPNGSDTKAGQTSFDNLYADPLLWMQQGWLDYLIPQVYWSMELPVASHKKIVDWWSKQAQNTNLYIGNGPYKIRNNSDKSWDNKKELPIQIKYARQKQKVNGNAFFSAKSLMKNNNDVVKYLKKRVYKRPALPPIEKNKIDKQAQTVTLNAIEKNKTSIIISFNNLKNVRYAFVYASGKKAKPNYPIKKLLTRAYKSDNNQIQLDIELVNKHKHIALIFVDKFGNESEPNVIHLKQIN